MRKPSKKQPLVIDLFSGCGGMSWGLHKRGFKVVAGIDNWPIALETFKANHPDAITYSTDIRELDAKKVAKDLGLKKGEVDCIVGGPPCQGFSKNVPATLRFLDDPRNQLFKDYLRFVRDLMPKVIVMENVAEMYNAFGGSVREEILKQLREMGYQVEVKVLYAPDYGIPQRRRRCVFFASRTGVAPVFPEPTHTKDNYISAWEAISDLPSIKNGGGAEEMDYSKEPLNEYQREMRREADVITGHQSRALRPKQYARLASLKAGQAFKDLPDELKPKSGFSGAYGRLDFKMIAPTITRWVFHPGSGRFGHPKDIRTITMREAARLHSFSDDFKLVGSNTDRAGQIGNAVPPRLMEVLSERIRICLEAETDPQSRLSSLTVSVPDRRQKSLRA